jgi:hypothetical protein
MPDKPVPAFNDLVSRKPAPDFHRILRENQTRRDRQSPKAVPPAKQ